MGISKLIATTFLSIVFSIHINATEIIGGNLRYESLGNQKYKVIGIVNRNCGGPSLDIPTFKVSMANTFFTLTATRTSITDITNYCKSTSTPCMPSNTQNSDGQEQHTFEATVDFSVAPFNYLYNPGVCEVIFSMESCCRSSKTTNITANDFYLEAMLNLCALGTTLENSSMEKPVSYIGMCVNLPFLYSFGYYEKDGDSLLHTIEIPKKSSNSFETFIYPFGTNVPMTTYCATPGKVDCKPLPNAKPPRGFYFDNNTGDIIITPSNLNDRAIIDIRTTEYRVINNAITLVGYSTTELFVKVQQCSDNNPPTLLSNPKWVVCEGDKLCFTIQSRDNRTVNATSDDTTFMSWNNGIPATNCTFIVDNTYREKSAQFCWQTKVGDAKPYEYQFSVNTTDSNCEQPLGTARTFIISVKPRAKPARTYQQPVCGKLIFTSIPDSIYHNISYTYEWNILDSSGSGTPLYKSSMKQDSFSFTKKGIYVISHTINNASLNCPSVFMDTIQIKCIGGGPTGIIGQNRGELNIYPNPSNGVINIDLDKNTNWLEMKLSNSLGQIVYSGPASSTLDMSRFAKGFYTLEVISIDRKYINSVIKQ